MSILLEELIVRSSVQVLQADKDHPKPSGFGSCCIVRYLGHTLFISVSHVTNDDGLTTFLETNLPPAKGTVPLRGIGGLIYFDILKINPKMDLSDFENLIENNGLRLDVTFAKVTGDLELKQTAIKFPWFEVGDCDKLILDLEEHSSYPTNDKVYGFYGNIRHCYEGIYLRRTPTLKYPLKFHRTNGYFHMFLAEEIITDKEDYEGCSGAPILDQDGNIVALACKIVVNTKIIYGFSIKECMKLIKITSDTNQL